MCRVACCVYIEAVEAFKQADNPQSKELASEAGALIRTSSNFEEEGSTFLMCSDCGKLACPDCIGLCPDALCGSQVCKVCSTFRVLFGIKLIEPTSNASPSAGSHATGTFSCEIAESSSATNDDVFMQDVLQCPVSRDR